MMRENIVMVLERGEKPPFNIIFIFSANGRFYKKIDMIELIKSVTPQSIIKPD